MTQFQDSRRRHFYEGAGRQIPSLGAVLVPPIRLILKNWYPLGFTLPFSEPLDKDFAVKAV